MSENKSKPAISTPIPEGGLGWSVIDDEEIKAVTDLLKKPEKLFRYYQPGEGQCALFEKEASEKLGVKHALFVNSGTSALTCCLAAWEIGPGDEVIVPAYTYIATPASVMDVGAVPIIAEIDESFGLDPEDVKKKITPHTRAIIAVHMQGIPGRLDELRKIAKDNDLYFIEDSCQAIGSKYHGKYTGVEADAFAWSLNYYKVITSGEGGVFFTNDDHAFLRGVYQSDPGTPMWDSELKSGIDEVPPFSRGGYRGNEVDAAIARVQLKKLDKILQHTRQLKKVLIDHLEQPINYQLQHVDDPKGECGISFGMIAHSKDLAEKFSEELKKEGLTIGTTYDEGFPDRHIYSFWTSVLTKNGATPKNYPWLDPAYQGNVNYDEEMCPRTLDILARSLRLGINVKMNQQNMIEIAEAINKVDRRL